ncbi:MarR family winged helix-turn-helix transcriptional regulator [Pseudohoeflea coraliihabitans]|uniref:MarR family transcriptional regulator n=1 Tax=Pseudohoeflea coraliihabitans TaxID=2860393 RepID=A0ABS6WKA3_9HYPH|nr:MarR family transcriptional regulator [Pseudohoeflea sp. DP4N28-3]MBW3096376.1 MarR family transcriptional regulator [Pseudohoeflea sp. DP4N28-3]
MKKNRKRGEKKAATAGINTGRDARAGAVLAAIAQVARSSRTTLNQCLSAHGLYAGQDQLMLALAQKGSQTAGALAQMLGVRAPTLTRSITRLAAQGLVRRAVSPEDGRLTLIELTEQGKGKISAIEAAQKETAALALTGLKNKDIRRLLDSLAVIDMNLAGASIRSEGQEAEPKVDGEAEKTGRAP